MLLALVIYRHEGGGNGGWKNLNVRKYTLSWQLEGRSGEISIYKEGPEFPLHCCSFF